jgi:hypothetical protein
MIAGRTLAPAPCAGEIFTLATSKNVANSAVDSPRGRQTLAVKHILNEHLDLSIRAADRHRTAWESCGDIIERASGKTIARVYGRGRSSALAEQEVEREAQRWALRNIVVR